MLAATCLDVLPTMMVQIVPKDSVSSPIHRPWVKVRLPAGSHDVEQIVDKWREQKSAAANLSTAIQLFDALDRGDLAQALEIYPALGLVVNSNAERKKNQKRPPLLRSSDLQRESDSSEEGGLEEMMIAICRVTHSDIKVNHRSVRSYARKFMTGGYTPNDLDVWLVQCWQVDWRGKKGDIPTIKELYEKIGHVRWLQPQSTEASCNTPAEASAPLPEDTGNLSCAARAVDEVAAEADTDAEITPWPPPEWEVPARINDMWLATKGQLQVQLNRATFDTWMRHAEPVHFIGDFDGGTLFVSVPHSYAKDWIDRHLLDAMNRAFNTMLRHRMNPATMKLEKLSDNVIFTITILVEGDLICNQNSPPGMAPYPAGITRPYALAEAAQRSYSSIAL